jgi:hypothetical protein
MSKILSATVWISISEEQSEAPASTAVNPSPALSLAVDI